MRIGLTGASGTLGRHIAAHLAQSGHQVVPFKGDVRERAAVLITWFTPLRLFQSIRFATIFPTRSM
jgi:nucleoside-diphosphate-sugar epimerase